MTVFFENKTFHHFVSGGTTIPYVLSRSRRRTLQITIKESSQVSVAAPHSLSLDKVEDFIRTKSNWILQKLAEKRSIDAVLQKRKYAHGEEFLFLGKKYPIEIRESPAPKPSLVFDNNRWSLNIPVETSLPERPLRVKEQLISWYRFQAKEILGARLFHFARITGLEPRKIVIKTQKTLWGSCSSHTRSIQLNWKLVLAPLEVIDYVIVHELSHLSVPNHSQRFWQKVKKVLPDYKARQQWLKNNHYDLALP